MADDTVNDIPDIDDAPAAASERDPLDTDLLSAIRLEKDALQDRLLRTAAEFDNYRKRMAAHQADQADRAAENLVGKLLPVLDACDAAVAHAVEGVEPIAAQLAAVLEREGLQAILPLEEPFDPEFHDAVMHEDGDAAAPTVAAVLRTGYVWKSRVIRPAMVKVRG